MKKFLGFLILFLVLYTSYLDLTNGTNFFTSSEKQPYQEIVVQKGETVLSVLEKMNGTLPVPIDEAIQDFQKLNPHVDPMNIEADKSYKFPVYDQN